MCGNAAALGRWGPGGPLLPQRGGFLARRNIPGWRGKDLFLRVKKNPWLMPEGAPQVGNTLGLWGAEGRSEQDTRRFVAQGQEIKAIKAKMSLTHTHKKKKEIFFAYFFSHARYRPARLERGGRGCASLHVCIVSNTIAREPRRKGRRSIRHQISSNTTFSVQPFSASLILGSGADLVIFPFLLLAATFHGIFMN